LASPEETTNRGDTVGTAASGGFSLLSLVLDSEEDEHETRLSQQKPIQK
jgi:hypothetical protein